MTDQSERLVKKILSTAAWVYLVAKIMVILCVVITGIYILIKGVMR